MLVTTFLLILLVNGIAAQVHVRIIATTNNGEKIPIDITVAGRTVTTISGQPFPVQPFFRQSVNLYDFRKHLEARKVIEENRCYIKKIKGSYDQMKKLVSAADKAKVNLNTKASEDWNIPGKRVDPKDLEKIVGPEIAKFCSGYDVVWMNVNKKLAKIQARRARRPWSAYLKAINDRNGLGATGGLRFNNGRGFSAGIGGTWRPGGGFSASAGLSWRFGK